MENAKELQKLAQVFNTDNIITNDDIEQVLKGILVIMNSFKKDNQSLNKETKEIVENIFNKILTEHEKLKESVNRETSDVKNEIQEKLATSLKEIKSLMEEVKSMKPKDGLDAVVDEEKIVQDVLSQIKLPEQKEIILDTPEEIANKLESLTGEARLDASAIKNLPATTVKGGGVRLLQYLADVNIQSPANNDVLKYNSTSKLWENGTGGGGGGAVDSVNGQTGVVVLDADDIDDTSTTNKFVTSADLTKLSNLSGTNTGDQTSIVGITGTKAEFDTAVTDGNFLYVGDITQYTDELAQDAVGGILTNSTFINLTYSDATPSITASLNATGTPSSSTYLRGDNTWATIGGGGDVTKVGTPVNNQVGVWTGDGTIEGTSGLTYDGSNLLLTGDLGSTGSRITKGWFTDLQVTNAISGSITGNAGTVTNATLTTALTVNTGTVTLTGNVANNSVLTIGAGAVSVSGTNTGDQTTISGNAGSATVLATPRAIYGNNFDGSAALTQIIASTYGGTGNGFTKFSGATTTEKTYTLPDASTTILTKNYTGALATGIVKNTTTTGELSIAVAGDFPTLNQNTTGSAATLTTTRTIWGQNFNGSANVTGDITLGTGNITMTGSIGATGARATKVWATDIESTNMPTVGGVAILTSLTAPQFTTIELGHATQNTLSASAGILSIEGVAIPTISSTDTLSNKTLTAPKFADLGYIADANGNELIILDTVTSAVNEITLANAATGNNPTFTASGGDANVGIDLTPKGTGFVQIKGNSTQAGTLAIYEDTDDGSNYSAFRGSARSGNIIYTLPTADPTAGQVLSAGAPSGGVSALSWSTPSSGGAPYTLLITDFASSGRFSQSTGSSGANTFGTHGVRISTGTAGNSHADVQWFITPQTQGRIWDDSPEFSCSISIRNAPNSGSNNGRAYIGLGALINSGGTSIDFTGKHVGFKLLQTSADTYTLYATQGDGTTETASSALTTVDDTPTSLELCLKINALSSVDYYWRKDAGAWSSATNLTTNLPTTGDGARAAQFIIIDEASSLNNEIEISGASYKR